MSEFGGWFARARSGARRAALLVALWTAQLGAAEARPVVSPDIDQYFSEVLLGLQKRKLESGLGVVINVDRTAPVVALSMTFPSGRSDGDAVPDIIGFAAGGDGRTSAVAILARLEMALGTERARRPEMARIVANFVLAREREPVLMRDKPSPVHSPHRK